MRITKEKKDKDKNKIKQSVKINITTSGGGGSGGSGIPSIPQPIYNSMQGQKTGENIETHNLLRQLLKSQQPIQQPLYYINPNRDNISDFKNESNNTLLQDINRDDNIDAAEKANRDDIDEQEDYINNINLVGQLNEELQQGNEQPQVLQKGIYETKNGKYDVFYKGIRIKRYDTIEEAQNIINYIQSAYPNDTGAQIKNKLPLIRQFEKTIEGKKLN